ncbi:MAG: MarR family winged helix-turn-helix transcriptional regulator [Thermoleophilia bacterium]
MSRTGPSQQEADGPLVDYQLPFGTFIKLCRATWSLTARVAASLPGDITYPQFVVLEALHTLGPMNQVTLGQKILRSSASVTVVVDNLERRALVERRRSTEDRRYVEVSLTSQGQELVKQIIPVYMTEVMEQFSVLTPRQQRQLGDLCRTIGLGQTEAGPNDRG